jgi:hypothetical protein
MDVSPLMHNAHTSVLCQSAVWFLFSQLLYYGPVFVFLKRQVPIHTVYEYFFEGCNSVIYVHAPLIFNFLGCLVGKKDNYKHCSYDFANLRIVPEATL